MRARCPDWSVDRGLVQRQKIYNHSLSIQSHLPVCVYDENKIQTTPTRYDNHSKIIDAPISIGYVKMAINKNHGKM